MKPMCSLVMLVMSVVGLPPPRAGAAAVRGPARSGRVQFITARRAYLDRGAVDGLVAGHVLQLLRGGRPAGRCSIERVGDHVALCSGPGIQVGDVFRVSPSPVRRPARHRPLEPPQDQATLQERARALASATFHKVEAPASSPHGMSPAVSVSVGATGWSGGAALDGGTPYLVAEVDGQIHRVAVGRTDLRLDLAFTALRWQLRPSASRFAPNVHSQFFLWEAQASRRQVEDTTVLAVGRILPWHMPGIAVFDGLQLGRRTRDGTSEAGIYLGSLPSVAGLAPTFRSWAAGAYAAFVHLPARAPRALGAALEMRAGAHHSPVAGQVREGDLAGQLFAHSWSAGAGGRASQSPARGGAPVLEELHAHLRLHGLPRVGGWIQVRYAGRLVDEEAVLRNETPSRSGAYHGAAGIQLQLSPAMSLGTAADAHADRETGDRSVDATAELALPRLFGDAGGLWLAGTFTEGWLRSRGAYAQFLGTLVDTRVLARIVARTVAFGAPQTNPDAAEVDGYFQLDRAVTEHWHLRTRATLTVPVSVQAQGPLPPRVTYQLGIDAVAAL